MNHTQPAPGFNFLTVAGLRAARSDFGRLASGNPADADQFFETYGVGNSPPGPERPHERFSDYQRLLRTLRGDDPEKFREVHKGTPFYFLAWTAFDLQDYERAVYYMDAAIAEDIRRDRAGWTGTPAGRFLMLDPSGAQAGERITRRLLQVIEGELARFNRVAGPGWLTPRDFAERFVTVLLEKRDAHGIVTSFYTFLLEAQDRVVDLELRGEFGGSLEPFLLHLFKGGLVFEAILKQHYPNATTLGEVFKKHTFAEDFECKSIQTRASSFGDILTVLRDIPSVTRAFEISSKLRNVAGHNLVWDDVFNDPENFKALHEEIVNAILFIVRRKY